MTTTRREILAGAFAIGAMTTIPALPAFTADAHPPMTVWKDANCGCCGKWMDHLRAAGFTVTAQNAASMRAIKTARGIPGRLESCHTAEIGGYLIEGHVPAADIARLLAEKPAIRGLSVPDMPLGSPGMEVPSGEVERYDVIAFAADGKTYVFARH